MCRGRRITPQKGSATAKFPMLGEVGMMMLEYVGPAPDIWFGDVTNAKYDFKSQQVRYVDVRDATFLLGPEFVEVV